MRHVFKLGGERKTKDGTPYTIEAVNDDKYYQFLADGWHASIEDINCIDAEFTEVETEESGSEYETDLRAKIKVLGGSPAGRSSIKTLENQLVKLELDHEQD